MTIQELLAGLETESNEKLKVVVFNVEDGEIAVYTRSDIDLEEYRGYENKRVEFWGVNGDRVIIHTAVREREPSQEEKHRMTCREWWLKKHSASCRGCPDDYPELKEAAKFCAANNPKRRNVSAREQCNMCWDQPAPEGVEE